MRASAYGRMLHDVMEWLGFEMPSTAAQSPDSCGIALPVCVFRLGVHSGARAGASVVRFGLSQRRPIYAGISPKPSS